MLTGDQVAHYRQILTTDIDVLVEVMVDSFVEAMARADRTGKKAKLSC